MRCGAHLPIRRTLSEASVPLLACRIVAGVTLRDQAWPQARAMMVPGHNAPRCQKGWAWSGSIARYQARALGNQAAAQDP